eukprot:8121827-Alexandrium_andersonii.AAC.1
MSASLVGSEMCIRDRFSACLTCSAILPGSVGEVPPAPDAMAGHSARRELGRQQGQAMAGRAAQARPPPRATAWPQ